MTKKSTFGQDGANEQKNEQDASDKKVAEDKAADDAGAGKLLDETSTDKDKLADEKDKPVGEDKVKEAEAEVPANDPHKPTAILNESEDEKDDRHEASKELGVQEVTDPDSQADTDAALEAGTKVVPGAAAGPDVAGVVRDDHGKVAYAPPGSLDAAMNGVQEDASGHVTSVHAINSSQSGVRI